MSRLPLDKICNNDKSLSEIQLEHEREDEFVVVVVKMVHEYRDCMMVVKEIVNRLLEEEEKLEWWFEQDIDVEEEYDEEGDGGSKVREFDDLNNGMGSITRQSMV
uniref:Uncharacterized protein n=1 Tax=Tanacetum cinerariifolium TaxID=118510 RepID=A0A6L2NJB8_TANCI|nr:hypothetical protein [Tanacetum cinerariifolium]